MWSFRFQAVEFLILKDLKVWNWKYPGQLEHSGCYPSQTSFPGSCLPGDNADPARLDLAKWNAVEVARCSIMEVLACPDSQAWNQSCNGCVFAYNSTSVTTQTRLQCELYLEVTQPCLLQVCKSLKDDNWTLNCEKDLTGSYGFDF